MAEFSEAILSARSCTQTASQDLHMHLMAVAARDARSEVRQHTWRVASGSFSSSSRNLGSFRRWSSESRAEEICSRLGRVRMCT